MTRNLVKRIFSASFSRLAPGRAAKPRHRAKGRRHSGSQHDLNSWDALEARVVLTATGTWVWGGGNLLGTLSGVGVVTGPVLANPQPLPPIPIPIPVWHGGMTTASGDTGLSQLETDWKALVTELQSLAAKSGVTVANIESLALDSQSIHQAGFQFNGSSLHTVICELATAVAGGALNVSGAERLERFVQQLKRLDDGDRRHVQRSGHDHPGFQRHDERPLDGRQ